MTRDARQLRIVGPWKVLLDLIDQALLINYVGEKAKELRTLGIRGSIELAALYDAIHRAEGTVASSGSVNMVVARIAGLLGEEADVVLNLIDTLHCDFQVQFIGSLWDGAYGSETSERRLATVATGTSNPQPTSAGSSPIPDVRRREDPPRWRGGLARSRPRAL